MTNYLFYQIRNWKEKKKKRKKKGIRKEVCQSTDGSLKIFFLLYIKKGFLCTSGLAVNHVRLGLEAKKEGEKNEQRTFFL